MEKLLLFFCVLWAQTIAAAQKAGSISGKVFDKQSNVPLAGATVYLKTENSHTITNNEGFYEFQQVKPGPATLVFSFVGYEKQVVSLNVIAGESISANTALVFLDRQYNEVVIAASQRPEKITRAPASVHKIGKKELEQFAGSNVHELFANIQGLEFSRSGIDYIQLNARGFNRVGNNKAFQLVDGRNSMTANTVGPPMYNLSSTIKDDIESVEIVLGPNTALYGPNNQSMLYSTTTKDPWRYPGTTLAVSAGNHYQFSGRLRHAAKINDKLAFKLTGEYAAGEDFYFFDSVFAGNQTANPNGSGPPAYSPKVTIPEQNVDLNFRRLRGEAGIYYKISPKTELIFSGGLCNSNFIAVGGSGRQIHNGTQPGFVQARIVHPRFFATAYNTFGNFGYTYSIYPYSVTYWNRTHSSITDPNDRLYKTHGRLPPELAETEALKSRFKERSQRFNADAQYNYTFKKAGLFLVVGISYQMDKPQTFGTILPDSFNRFQIRQIGGVVHLEKTLPWDMNLIGALRVDNHSNIGTNWAPKLAVTKSFGERTIRVSYAKGYTIPNIMQQSGILNNGLVFGNGAGITYTPNKTPIDPPHSYIPSLMPEQVTTLEIGYKGVIVKNLYLDANYYYGINKNFISPPILKDGRILKMGDYEVTNSARPGKVDENGILDSANFLTYFNYAEVKAYGLDAGLTYYFSNHVNLSLKYSWFGSNIAEVAPDANEDGYVAADEKSINAPEHRVIGMLNFQNLLKKKVFVNIIGRFTEFYDFYSVNNIGIAAGKGKRGVVYRPPPLTPVLKNFDWGPLGGFTIFNVSAGYKLNEMINLNLNVTNLFDAKQLEMVSSPAIGRLIMFEIRVHIP